LTPRFNGETVGEEKHTMLEEELAKHTHKYKAGTRHGKHGSWPRVANWADGDSGVGAEMTATMTETGVSQPFNVMQPTTFMNLIIKL
jgi:microcystin-dependent protein